MATKRRNLKDLDPRPAPLPPVAILSVPKRVAVICTLPSRETEALAWIETLQAADATCTRPSLQDLPSADVDIVLLFEAYESLGALDSETLKKVAYVWAPEEDTRIMAQASAITPVSVKEVWVYPQSVRSAQVISVLTKGTNVRVVPQLYSPAPLLSSEALGGMYTSAERDSAEGMDVVILSDLVSPTSSVLLPLLACEIVESQNAEKIRNIILACAPDCPHPLPPHLFANYRIAPKIVSVECTAAEIVPYFMERKQYSMFVYHQADKTECPQLLWDLAYKGFPVAHNLKTSMAAGITFEGDDVIALTKLLEVDKISFGADYVERTHRALAAVAPTGEAALDTMKRILIEW